MNALSIFLIISGILNIAGLFAIIYLKNSNSSLNNKIEKNKEREKLIENSEKLLTEKQQTLDKIYADNQEKLKKEYAAKMKQVSDIVNCSYREGYYNGGFNQTIQGERVDIEATIYVVEVDRYTNGKSKIKFKDVEFVKIKGDRRIFNKSSMTKFITENFIQLVDTKDIEWLESVDELSKARAKKFERILNQNNSSDAQ